MLSYDPKKVILSDLMKLRNFKRIFELYIELFLKREKYILHLLNKQIFPNLKIQKKKLLYKLAEKEFNKFL